MIERSQFAIYIGLATLLIVIGIAALLIRRGGRSGETKAILDAIEGARRQIDTLDQATQGDLKTVKNWLWKLLNRFGFMKDAP